MDRNSDLIHQAEQTVAEYKDIVNQDKYRLHFHLMPPVGLLNDPNGFIHWEGRYHLFYQWNPFKTSHGAKFWGHYSSSNLVDWKEEKIALAPSEWFEKNGCYSGSAVEDNGKLKLLYTGNVKDEQGNRETYQCLAESTNGTDFKKKGVVLRLPEGYTAHFRDPKVWKYEGKWYMVIGAQSAQLEGRAVLFSSNDLEEWTIIGDVAGTNLNGLGNFGYMWECPDLFQLEENDILLVSPQGLKPEGMLYQNVYNTGYFVGKLDYQTGALEHGEFFELDRGFEFYAPQTTVDDQGRRLMFGWMGVPEQEEDKHPTIAQHWIHAMTIPRELLFRDGRILQQPVKELQDLRINESTLTDVKVDPQHSFSKLEGSVYELQMHVEEFEAQQLEISIKDSVQLRYNKKEQVFTLERVSLTKGAPEVRQCQLTNLTKIQVFVDTSAIEIFINDGQEVFTARMFPEDVSNKSIVFKVGDGHVKGSIQKWDFE
ncbi:sucrose-6-phosphate hydrolase [Alkalihalobacterium chitinilyticum]|uniref:Sucrose-6-phosphate hydrolase n=1 Tax=Alkalihalobacterium chitinilyticum TaxID=2980103 RepID=A0ABT5VG56_9BACI|nr:sucrose-6-phosphate hydrolase [Alkalihalobacterium chitinilyticum]MDE5414440.1 sucrose-6-phosphate hydrolase [Alkalihalobacterium chitinilyticum]